MKVGVLCPTRDRPKEFDRLCQSVIATSTQADVLAYIDDDQPELYQPTEWSKMHPYGTGRVRQHVGPRIGPAPAANALVKAFPGYDAYGMVTDDAIMTVPGWDQWLLDVIASFPNRICVVSPYHNQGNHVDMPFVSKEWIAVTGWFACPEMKHYCWPIVTGLIAEMTGICHAGHHDFAVFHKPKVEMVSLNRREQDAQAFFEYVSLGLPAVVQNIRRAMGGA